MTQKQKYQVPSAYGMRRMLSPFWIHPGVFARSRPVNLSRCQFDSSLQFSASTLSACGDSLRQKRPARVAADKHLEYAIGRG